jgi:chromosome segregation ATPase
MKLKNTGCWAFLLMLIVMFGSVPPCSAETASDTPSMAEVKQQTQDLIQALKSYSAEQRDKAIKQTKAALSTLDKRIDALESRIDNHWDKMDKTAREKARASMNELHKQRTQVAELYGSLKSSSAEAWEHVKKGFADAYGALQAAWEKSEKEVDADK